MNTIQKIIKILSIGLGIIAIIILIILRSKKLVSNWVFLWMFLVALIVCAIFAFFYFKDVISKKFKEANEEDKTPKAITLEQARELAKNATKTPDFADYTDSGEGETIFKCGDNNDKNWIYCRRSIGEYTKDYYFVLINMHFPDKKDILILEDGLGDKWWANVQLKEKANLLSTVPMPPPSTRETSRENILTGVREDIKEIMQKQNEENKNKEESQQGELK